jgi:hypothetical protein
MLQVKRYSCNEKKKREEERRGYFDKCRERLVAAKGSTRGIFHCEVITVKRLLRDGERRNEIIKNNIKEIMLTKY